MEKDTNSQKKPNKFFKVLGLLVTGRFADAVEYANKSDTEN